jgi:hypothetical protein
MRYAQFNAAELRFKRFNALRAFNAAELRSRPSAYKALLAFVAVTRATGSFHF